MTDPEAPTDWRGLDPALLSLRRLEVLSSLGLLTLLAGGLLGVLVGVLAGVAALAAGVALALLGLRWVQRRFASWSYAERQDDLLLRRGVLVERTTVVPYGRMQFVDVSAGPLDRRYGLASVVLHTAAAATSAHVPGLRRAEAERLRDRLAALGEARAAGVE